MANVILLVACFLIGILLKRSKRLPENAHAAWNGFVIHVSLPALTLIYVHDLKLSTELLFPVAMPWIGIPQSPRCPGNVGDPRPAVPPRRLPWRLGDRLWRVAAACRVTPGERCSSW